MILLAASAAEEALPTLSGTVLPLRDGGRGGVADTARLDCDFSPAGKNRKILCTQHTNEVKVYFYDILIKHHIPKQNIEMFLLT